MEDRDSVFVPKDLSKIKTKFLFGLTRRQCLFFGFRKEVKALEEQAKKARR